MTPWDTTPERLQAHVYTLADAIGERNVFRPRALEAAADYITQEWRRQGYPVTAQTYPVRQVSCANLEVIRYGARRPERVILLGAHYDSVLGCPGANDNASAVAALLEISRLFTRLEPALTVRLVAFVNEEPPFFLNRQMGSQLYAAQARRRGDDIRLMASLETLGYYSSEPGSQRYPPLFRWFYPERGDFIAFVSNLRSRRVMRRVMRAFRAQCDFPCESVATLGVVPGVSWSDHRSFWEQGYAAFMVTDTAFYRYAYYHTPQDTAEKLCYGPLAQVTNGLYRAFAALAHGRHPADAQGPR